jgi:hypothetical protein
VSEKVQFLHTNWTRTGASLKAPLRPGCSQCERVQFRRLSPSTKGFASAVEICRFRVNDR